ncbi:MAG: hypothetical protein IKW21_05455, partial [Lachnospiraceae bacterium]|nr:hypothetical protein [Lachnospiraceae bacterium]
MAYSKLTKEKTKEKEKADALAKQSANVSSKPNVTEKKKKVKKNASGNRALVMESSVRTLGIKCYEEQFPKGWADVCALIRKIDKKRYQVIGIKHDKDPDLGDKWGASTEKAHYHIYIRVLGNSSVKVRTLLNLVGCVYRPGLDDSLWDEHGVETLGSFSASAMYATHETPQAILDGKTPYPFEELVSNLTTDELKQVRDGYVRVTDTKTKLTIEELNDLDKEAYKLGYELKDFEEWYHAHPLAVRKQSTVKQFKESYNYGVKVRVS